jgi:hypothetical protein
LADFVGVTIQLVLIEDIEDFVFRIGYHGVPRGCAGAWPRFGVHNPEGQGSMERTSEAGPPKQAPVRCSHVQLLNIVSRSLKKNKRKMKGLG